MELENNKDNVTVYRYIRPSIFVVWWDNPEYVENSNLYGVTIRFDIDYINRVVTAGWTVCDGVNFSKEVGVSLADHAYVKVEFNYVDVDIHSGLTNALIAKLSEMYPKYSLLDYWSPPAFGDKLTLFRRALRED